jgi:subtilisin-like proprotein convertase family protein
MDYHSRKLRFWAAVGAVVCVFQYSALADGYYSFGRTVNKSFGKDYEKTLLTENIFVPTAGGILDIDLALNIEHTSICDLQISLVSPAGTYACINSYDVYTFVPGRQNFRWTIFDAESPFDIDSGTPPFNGAYRPNGPDSLTAFYGQQSCGTWQVRVYDAVFGDTGTFKGVRLDFHINPEISPQSSTVPLLAPEPSTLLLFTFPAAIGISSRRRQTRRNRMGKPEPV